LHIFFYKSEKSEGIVSRSSIELFKVFDHQFQKIVLPNCSIFSNIFCGSAYFLTSNQSSFPNIGKTNIVKTVTTIPIIAYLIVFRAGTDLSSFHHDSISNIHHHNIKRIDRIPETNTNIEIVNNTKSQNSILLCKI